MKGLSGSKVKWVLPTQLHPAGLATFLVLVYGLVGPTRGRADPDTWWHLRTGQLILDTASIPSYDPFSWTASGRPWVPHEWLSQVAFAKAFDMWGASSLLIINGLLVGTALTILHMTLRRLGVGLWSRAIALAFAATFSSITWTVRPHVFSILFLSAFLYLVLGHYKGWHERSIWLLVPLTLVWANMHGVFVSGLGLVWIFAVTEWVGHRKKQLAFVAAVATCVAMINPNGPGAFIYPLHVARVSAGILEWEPPGLRDLYGASFLLSTVAIPSLFAWSKRRPDAALYWSWLVFSIMAMAAVKNVWMAGLVMAPLFAVGLDGLNLPPSTALRGERVGLLAVACLGTVAALAFAASNLTGSDSDLLREDVFPIAAVDALNERPPGDVANPYGWGGYLIWAAPRFRVSIDGRNDMYGMDLLKDDETLTLLRPGWKEFLAHPNVRYVLWPRSGLGETLSLVDGWRVLYEDRKAILYERVEDQLSP